MKVCRVCSRYAAISMNSKTRTLSVCGIWEDRNTHRILEYFKLEGIILWVSFIQISFSLSLHLPKLCLFRNQEFVGQKVPKQGANKNCLLHSYKTAITGSVSLFSVGMQPATRNMSSKLTGIWLTAERRNTEEIGREVCFSRSFQNWGKA